MGLQHIETERFSLDLCIALHIFTLISLAGVLYCGITELSPDLLCLFIWYHTLCVFLPVIWYCVIHMTNQLLYLYILLSNLMNTKLVKIISDNIKFLIKFVVITPILTKCQIFTWKDIMISGLFPSRVVYSIYKILLRSGQLLTGFIKSHDNANPLTGTGACIDKANSTEGKAA